MERFSDVVCERLQYYIYALIDPRDGKIFYVGKGKGNRVFDHAKSAQQQMNIPDGETNASLKISIINDIWNSLQKEPSYYILRHGISVDNIAVKNDNKNKDNVSEGIAFELESLMIDFLSYRRFPNIANLSNIQSGHDQWERGIKTVEEIEQLYNPQPVDIRSDDGLILVLSIKKTYPQKKDLPDGVYQATRESWALGRNEKKVGDIKCVLGVYNGIVRGAFFPKEWKHDEYKTKSGRIGYRWSFAKIKDEEMDNNQKDLYNRVIDKANTQPFGNGNPVTYYNNTWPR